MQRFGFAQKLERLIEHSGTDTSVGKVVGISAAAAVASCMDVAESEARAGREAVVVTILCDSADKYLSERFWTEPADGDEQLAAKLAT